MLQVRSAEERGLSVAHSLHQSFSGLRHLLHLHVVQQATLLLTGYTCREEVINVSDVFVFVSKQNSVGEMLSPEDTTVILQQSVLFYTSQ